MINTHCPICDRVMGITPGQGPKEWPQWPFCSPRCRLVDLGRWLGGTYRLPDPAMDSAMDAPTADALPEDEDDDSPKPAVPSAVPHKEA